MAGKLARGDVGAGESYVPVTPNDDEDLPNGICRTLLVGTAGAADLVDAGGTTRTGVPLIAGYNPLAVKRVLETTVASNIWALY